MVETASEPPFDEPPVDEDLQHVERRSSSAGCVVFGIIFALGFYVLSPPLVMLLLGGPPPGSPIHTIVTTVYFPLEWMYQEIPFVRAFYDWYFEATGVR